MRILFCLVQKPTHSQSYITTEVEYLESLGHDVVLWVFDEVIDGHPPGPSRAFLRRSQISLPDAIAQVSPDIVHLWCIHVVFMEKAFQMLSQIQTCGVPITIRGHTGFETDPRSQVLARMAQRFWLNTNHVAALSDDSRFHPTPVAYKASVFVLGVPSQSRYVFRAGGAVPGKGLDSYTEVACRCPNIRFMLCLASIKPRYMEQVKSTLPPNVEFHCDLPMTEIADLTQHAWVCLRGHGTDPKDYAYGMPVSMAEALGCGIPIIARRDPPVEEFLGPAGIYYGSDDEAVQCLRSAMDWSIEDRAAASKRSLKRALLYRDDVVYPPIVSEWEKLIAESW